MASEVERWVKEQARLAEPSKIHLCDGSEEEARQLIEIGMKEEKIDGHPIFYKLNQKSFPQSYLHRSHALDIARTEHLTYISFPDKHKAGPNNNWLDPREAKKLLKELSSGCMKGRTMYVLPFTMSHPDSPLAKACIQITDNTYVAVSMQIMTRLEKCALEKINRSRDFVKGFHALGDLDPNRCYIMHFPEKNLVWNIGSGYGGNALLGKKFIALRIASFQGFKEGWLAEHMIILGIEDPQGKITYLTAALPSASGKTNLALMEPLLPGYKIWTLGDDIAWMYLGQDGRL